MSYNSHAVEVGYYDYTVTASVHTAKLSFFSPDKLTLYVDGVQTNFLPKCHLYPTPVLPEDAPVSPPPSPTAASDDMLQTADITLNPGQTYHIQVIFDNTLSPVSNFSGFSGYLWGCNHGSGPFDSVAVSVMDESDPSNHDTTVGSFVEASLVSEARYGSGLLPESFGLSWSWAVSKVYDQNDGNKELKVNETLSWKFDPDSGSKNPIHNKLKMVFGKAGKFGVEVAATCSWTTPIPTVQDSNAMGKTVVVVTVGAGGTGTKVEVDKTSLKFGYVSSNVRTIITAPAPKRSDSKFALYNKSAGDRRFKAAYDIWVKEHAFSLRVDGYVKVSITPAIDESKVTWVMTVPAIGSPSVVSSMKVGDTQVVVLKLKCDNITSGFNTDIQFKINSVVQKIVQCKLIVPVQIDSRQENHGVPTTPFVATGDNFEANQYTSPAAWNVDPAYKSNLWTTYTYRVKITILDQETNPLDGLYEGAPIDEKAGSGNALKINLLLDSNGSYMDPVGVFGQLTSPKNEYDPKDQNDSDTITAWTSVQGRPAGMPPYIDPPIGSEVQNIALKVGGVDLVGPNGIVNRTITTQPSGNVKEVKIFVNWPKRM